MSRGGGNEYVVRVPKNSNKRYSVMRFGGGDMMDVKKWTAATMTRDMSAKKIYQDDEAYPEFGAGSEYGRKQKEEARKLKYGQKKSKFNVDGQPWNLSVNTQAKAPYSAKNKNKDAMVPVTKEFIGRKEGGIGEGSMYFVFMQTPDRAFEAYPVDSWYNFTRKIKHRTLTDEEAEAEWDKRDKILNHLNYMARKRLQIDEENEDDEEGNKRNKAGKSKKTQKTQLIIHDEVGEDKLLMSDSDDSDDDDAMKKKKISKKQKDLKHDTPEEGLEDSDDGDGEGVEQDYNSDISSEEETTNEVRMAPKGLDELDSSSSSDEGEETQENDASKKVDKRGSNDEMSSSGDSDIDSDIEKETPALLMAESKASSKIKKGAGINSNSRSGTPVAEVLTKDIKKAETSGRASPKVGSLLGKRHANFDIDTTSVKRIKSGSLTPTKDLLQPQNQLNEDMIRRCLQHKPITPKDLLKKFNMKKTGMKKDEIVNTVAAILKKLEPEQKKINGKMHLYLKQP